MRGHIAFAGRYAGLIFFACALLVVFGSKMALLDRYGSDLPYWDQWGKEADWILAPLREGNPAWLPAALLPHNEHRIYFTLGVDVLLTLVSGQFEERQRSRNGCVQQRTDDTFLARIKLA